MTSIPPPPPTIPGDAYFKLVSTDQQVITKKSVTQTTNINTSVTINAACGTIITVPTGVPAGTNTSFNVINSFCAIANNLSPYTPTVFATVNGYQGSGGGMPFVISCIPNTTGFTLRIANLGGEDIDGAITIAFLIC